MLWACMSQACRPPPPQWYLPLPVGCGLGWGGLPVLFLPTISERESAKAPYMYSYSEDICKLQFKSQRRWKYSRISHVFGDYASL